MPKLKADRYKSDQPTFLEVVFVYHNRRLRKLVTLLKQPLDVLADEV
ncbi:MAG: hypothetical protein P0119_06870 [Nitrospira sp.]|nr:hypothetical protein [Nitrospira sp.]